MKFRLALLCGLVALGTWANTASATTLVVDPANSQDWSLYNLDDSETTLTPGTATFVTGPATPPLGTGSVNLSTPAGQGAAAQELRNTDWAGTKLSALTTLSYSTYATAWNGSQDTFLTLYISTTGASTYDDRLVFEPAYSAAGAGNGDPSPQNDPALDTWQNWNLLTGMWYDDNATNGSGPGTAAIQFGALLAAYPDATIVNDNGNGGIGGLRVTVGEGSDSDNFSVDVDNFSIGTAAGTTTYNFDPTATGSAVPEPITAGLGLMGLAALALTASRRRRVV